MSAHAGHEGGMPGEPDVAALRASLAREHAQVLEGYRCLTERYASAQDSEALDRIAQSRAAYDRLFAAGTEEGASLEVLKRLAQENNEAFAGIESHAHPPSQDVELVFCSAFGFHFQDISMRAGNDPL